MPVDDSPFALAALAPSDPGGVGDDADSPSGAPSGDDASSPGVQLAGLMQTAIGPHVEATTRQMQAMEARINQLTGALAAAGSRDPAGDATKTDGAGKTLIERFVENPEAILAEVEARAEQRVTQRMAPYILGSVQETQEKTLREQQARVDGIYGEGTFEQVLVKDLINIFQEMPEQLRFNPKAIRRSVDSLLGSEELRPELDKRRETRARKAHEAKEAERKKPPSFLGNPRGGADANGEPVIDQNDRAVMAKIAENGFDFSESDMRLVRKLPKGVSLDDQLDALERMTPKRAGSKA